MVSSYWHISGSGPAHTSRSF